MMDLHNGSKELDLYFSTINNEEDDCFIFSYLTLALICWFMNFIYCQGWWILLQDRNYSVPALSRFRGNEYTAQIP